MSFTPKEVILGATLPLENGSTVTFSIAGHVEAERDYDDAAVIFGRKLLHYTNCATDADRLTVRQVVASITSTPLDKVPDVGKPTSPAPDKEPAKVAPPVAAPTPGMGPGPYSGGASGGGRRTVHQAAHGCTKRTRAECTADPGSLRACGGGYTAGRFQPLCRVRRGRACEPGETLAAFFQGKTLCKQCMEAP